MPSDQDRISEEAARAIWRRAAQLQAEAERRMEEGLRRVPAKTGTALSRGEGLHPEEVRAAGEEAGISPEFVQIALAEASASGKASLAIARHDLVGARLFLGATRHTIEATTTVQGSVDTVAAAVLQVFSGYPCLLQTGEVAELPSGRVIVFNVPKYDWSATANLPFVEKAAMVGLKQLRVAVRPFPARAATCEVVVAGDLHPGMRTRWRWSAVTTVAIAGVFLVVPTVVGAAVMSGATVGAWALGYRYYRAAVEEALKESLQLLSATARAVSSAQGGKELSHQDRALP